MRVVQYIILMFIIVGCKQNKKEFKDDLFFKEINLPYNLEIQHIDKKEFFFEQIINNKYSFERDYKWIRNKKNILELHAVLKKIGYKNLVSDSVYDSKIFTNPVDKDFDWYNLSSRNVIDSLLYYETIAITDQDNYYTRFWKRRIKEGNDKEVFKVISEIQKIYEGKNYQIESVEDKTLYNLINLNYHFISDRNSNAGKQYISYLIKKGLHQSAYNTALLYPKISKDSLSKLLEKDDKKKRGNWVVYSFDDGP